MIVSCREMKEIEAKAFASGVEAEALMECAGRQIAQAVCQFFPVPGVCTVFYGKGHNGGDALVAARYLADVGWQIELAPVYPENGLAPLTRKKLEEFNDVSALPAKGWNPLAPQVALDGLLGIGAKGPLRPEIEAAVEQMAALKSRGAYLFALDIPTGLDGDTGEVASKAVEADFTLAIAYPKHGLLADGAVDYVGRLAVLPLPELERFAKTGDTAEVATLRTLAGLKPRRRFSMHKGECGRVGIIAGSRGLTGAAVMCANAAVRAGAGLVTLFVAPDAYATVAATAMPEVMVTPIGSYSEVLQGRFDALGVGPGLGSNAFQHDAEGILEVIEHFPGPMVIDADALNLLSLNGLQGNLTALLRRRGPRLLTPHPGEMARLAPESAGLSRLETVRHFLALFPGEATLALLLKGARTIVGSSDGAVSYNSTGSPGMATGGMGDVLTGTCAALLGQGLGVFDAGRLGAWICGRAAEHLVVGSGWRSEESLAATDLLEVFGQAFREIRSPDRFF